MGKQDLTPMLLLTISLVSQFLPSLINSRLNLPFGAQGRSWRLSEGCFLSSEKRGHKGLGPRSPTGPCMPPCNLMPLIDCFLFAKTSIIVLNSSGWECLLSSWKYLHLCMHACPLNWDRLWNHMDCSPPGSSVHGIFQASTFLWVVISYSKGSSRPRDWTHPECFPIRQVR